MYSWSNSLSSVSGKTVDLLLPSLNLAEGLVRRNLALGDLWGDIDSDLADGDLDLQSLPDLDDSVVVLLSLVDLAKANMKCILNQKFIYEVAY